MNNLLSAHGEMGEDRCFEGFLRDCATQKNIYTIGIFDSCRRKIGRGGLYTHLEECYNVYCLYREEDHDFTRECPCEPWSLPNMAELFFDHLKALPQV